MSSSFNLQLEQAFKIGVLYRTYAYLAATTFMLYDSFDIIASEARLVWRYILYSSSIRHGQKSKCFTCSYGITHLFSFDLKPPYMCHMVFWLVPINKRRGGMAVLTTTVNAILALRIGAFYNNERNCLNLTVGPPGYPVCWGPNADIARARRSHNYLLIGGIGTMVTSCTAVTSNWRSFIQLKLEPLAKIYIRDGFVFFFIYIINIYRHVVWKCASLCQCGPVSGSRLILNLKACADRANQTKNISILELFSTFSYINPEPNVGELEIQAEERC
ncbi:hypothetical protein BDQ17DRAFT_1411608 [Cyathus striatus]|nr:hypothetical protein BDQ17DRAFT_1411608 [Cyathus striatus]